MEQTLLQKAQNIKKGPNTDKTKEEQELAIAFLYGHITLTQLMKAAGLKNTSLVYPFAFFAIRTHILENGIKLSNDQ